MLTERQNMNTVDRENAVLASFLYSDDMGEDTDKAFLLAEDAFMSEFRKRVAVKINATTTVDKAYSVLSYDIENSVSNTVFEQDWINVLAQTPLPLTLAKRYHDDIRSEYDSLGGDRI